MAHVMTVCGPISPDELGFTLPHEHIFVDLTAFPGGITIGGLDAIIDPVRHMEIMIEELKAYQSAGGKSVVDVTCRNLGGDIRALKRVAEATGANIIAGCGWYRESYMDHDIYYQPTNELAEDLIKEIENGLGDTGIRPGIIGEIGVDYSHYHLSAKEERCLRAMAKAQRRSGLAITTHLPKARVAFEVLDVLGEHGVPPDRVIIGHSDIYKDAGYHAALMTRGAYVQYDNIGSDFDAPRGEPDLLDLVVELVRRGHGERILLSHDICCRSHLKYYHGRGFDYLATQFLPRLREMGISEEEVQIMTVENPKRVLSV
jgi:predicted metal-dependent phosphotriesterase family hydrolase